ncbi:unnamed protein product, partial [marine sediment metagenome]
PQSVRCSRGACPAKTFHREFSRSRLDGQRKLAMLIQMSGAGSERDREGA